VHSSARNQGPDRARLDPRNQARRLIVQREGKRGRLFTRNGHDWTDRYPLIVEAALKNRSNSFVIDGEAVLLGVDGVSDFDGLHSRKFDAEVQLYAFDALMLEGDDLRQLPLSMRKTNLARLLARRPEGIFVALFEQGEIGPDLFRKACEFKLEGLVSNIAAKTAPLDDKQGRASGCVFAGSKDIWLIRTKASIQLDTFDRAPRR
jgi:ATP-dependent DNA ligase